MKKKSPASSKLAQSSPTKKELANLFRGIGSSFIKEMILTGRVKQEGKKPEEVRIEALKILLEELKKHDDLPSITDYRETLLNQARKLKKNEHYELSLVIFAIWTEHFINGLIELSIKRAREHPNLVKEIIRDTNIKAKMGWLSVLLGWPNFSSHHKKNIDRLMEERNSFVHYKWQISNDNQQEKLISILQDFEKTVKYIKKYQSRIFGAPKKGTLLHRKDIAKFVE